MANVPRSSFVAHSDPRRVFDLAMAAFKRYQLSEQREDLDIAILHFTESILLRPRSWLESGSYILSALSRLSLTLLTRSELYEMPEDAIYAAKYLRHLRDQPHQVFGSPRHEITTFLVKALTSQVKLEAGDVMQNIGEMAALCRELLTLNISDVDITPSITLFAGVVLSKIDLLNPDQPLDQVIECLRASRKHKPYLRETLFALAYFLTSRYHMTLMTDDYEEAVCILDEIIAYTSPGDSGDERELVAVTQELVTLLAILRSETHATPEHSEEAIYRARAFLSSSFVNYHRFVPDLEGLAEQRFSFFGSIEGIEASSGNSRLSQPLSNGFNDERTNSLVKLRDGIRSGDITKIDEAIKEARSILALITTEPDRLLDFNYFGEILFEAFERTKKIEFLNESIGTHRQVFQNSTISFLRSSAFLALFLALLTRSKSFPDHRSMQDLDEIVKLLSQSVNDELASLFHRFQWACWWAPLARSNRHPSVSTAYERALSLMQDSLDFAPTLQLQHATLAKSDNFYKTPLEYASYQVDQGHLEGAIQTLERGRALLWSEMRHLHTSIDQLLHADPDLGHKFAAVNRDLEELTKSVPPSHEISIDNSAVDDLRAVDPFGRLLLKQRSLLKERHKLISQIRALPGFDSFLTSPSFDVLRSAASSGPVIIINHSKWRSDILILHHNTPPSLIPTPPDFYDRACALKDNLLDSRNKHGLDSSDYEKALASVLAELYEFIGKPVIDRLVATAQERVESGTTAKE